MVYREMIPIHLIKMREKNVSLSESAQINLYHSCNLLYDPVVGKVALPETQIGFNHWYVFKAENSCCVENCI